MFMLRRLPLSSLLTFAWRWMAVGAGTAAVAIAAQALTDVDVSMPFLPISTVGTAVAFYLGFKNNASYDRYWEARKIWGGVVNSSRTWANQVLMFLGNDRPLQERLVRRQIAWVHALRLQLRKTSKYGDSELQKRAANWLRQDWDGELGPRMGADELAEVSGYRNPATHLVRLQGRDLATAHGKGVVDLFHQIALADTLTELYTLQGKCERIKNTPLPRQYAAFSSVFVWVFVLLVPVGLLDVFGLTGPLGFDAATVVRMMLMLASCSLITWVFITMELIGSHSEDPFERGVNDVNMTALSLTIESDLLEMLGHDPVEPLAALNPPGVLY